VVRTEKKEERGVRAELKLLLLNTGKQRGKKKKETNNTRE